MTGSIAAGSSGVTVLAAGPPSAGPLALLVIVLLGVATVLLIRNMNGHLRRLPRDFEERPAREEGTPPGDGPAAPPPAG